MVNKNLLLSKIVSNGYTQSAFAKTVGMSPQKFSSKVNGRTRFTADEILDTSKMLALDRDTTWEIFFTNNVD